METTASGHTFHVPVMGTGFTIDSPLRIGKFGISTVVSLVDDNLIEKVRREYAKKWDMPYERIRSKSGLDRARRITAYFNLIADILERQIATIRALPFEPGNDKAKYFELLPHGSPLKQDYEAHFAIRDSGEREASMRRLNDAILPGRVGCNIMTKADAAREFGNAPKVEGDLTDAKSALKGFAEAKGEGDVILSAGVNPTLFGFIENFPAFYADENGKSQKRIILKVSDLRSSLIQGKLLAKKGLRIAEFRVESGLNCGGHVFATEGLLMGPILEAFKAERARFDSVFEPLIAAYYSHRPTLHYAPRTPENRIRITAQGGIGTAGEAIRLMEDFGLDSTGWASPFLLVPEATALDAETRKKLAQATSNDFVVSNASPLGVPFNNLRTSSSEEWSEARIEAGTPGSPCPNGYIRLNSEFEGPALCVGSSEYMAKKLDAMGHTTPPTRETASPEVQAMYDKRCICCHLGNGALIDLGVALPGMPVAVCPGPNLVHFDRSYSLVEMVDHIYGRRPSLVSADRPHMFAKELVLYVDHLAKMIDTQDVGHPKVAHSLKTFIANLKDAFGYYLKLAEKPAYPLENIASLGRITEEQHGRLLTLEAHFLAALPDADRDNTTTGTDTAGHAVSAPALAVV